MFGFSGANTTGPIEAIIYRRTDRSHSTGFPVLIPPAPLKHTCDGKTCFAGHEFSGANTTGPIEAMTTSVPLNVTESFSGANTTGPIEGFSTSERALEATTFSGANTTGPIEAQIWSIRCCEVLAVFRC